MPEFTPLIPVCRVTLYTSGVAFFERGGEVEGNTTLTLNFPTGQINDVLASLVLLDHGGGSVQPVTYGAQDPLSKSLSAFSVNLGDNPSRAALLDRMRGAAVRITTTTGAKPIAGVILGVETREALLPNEQGVVSEESVNLLVGKGLRCLALKDIDEIELEDAGLAEELNLAIASVARSRDQSKRPLSLSFAGEGTRNVTVAYLVEAPAWQTSYRLVLTKSSSDTAGPAITARLQGWAIVQNTTADDWEDVTLTLVSGRPISFIQDLYTPLYIHRPTVQSRIESSPHPQTYDSGDSFDDRLIAYDTEMPAAVAGGRSKGGGGRGVANVRQRKEETGLNEVLKLQSHVKRGLITADEFDERMGTGSQMGDALFSYAIDIPVTVPREQSAMIPFLSTDVQCERVTIYNPATHFRHPLLGVSLTNDSALHLMGGPITVFAPCEDGSTGYTGQALIDDTEPSQRRLITFAVDLAMTVIVTQTRSPQEVIAFTIAQGVLRTRRRHVRKTVYQASNHDENHRTIVIEHEIGKADWDLVEPPTAEERTGTHYRFYRPLGARSGVNLEVRQEHVVIETLSLTSAVTDQLSYVMTHEVSTPHVREALEMVLAHRKEIAQVEDTLENTRKQLAEIDTQQSRIRQNLAAIDHGSDLYRRYIAQLDSQETMVAKLTEDIAAAESDLQGKRGQLDSTIAAIEL
jgi:hypothetical protein